PTTRKTRKAHSLRVFTTFMLLRNSLFIARWRRSELFPCYSPSFFGRRIQLHRLGDFLFLIRRFADVRTIGNAIHFGFHTAHLSRTGGTLLQDDLIVGIFYHHLSTLGRFILYKNVEFAIF